MPGAMAVMHKDNCQTSEDAPCCDVVSDSLDSSFAPSDVPTASFVRIPANSVSELRQVAGHRRTVQVISSPSGDTYELLDELGRGGMGIVYKARQKSLNRIVAIKLIRTDHVAHPHEIERFERETVAAARLDHPGIVSVYDAGTHEGWPFYVMAYVEGVTLAKRIAESRLTPCFAARVAEQLAATMAYVHQQGVVHRDLKPSNVLLDTDHRPYITDFGLAKLLGPATKLTASGVVVGSLPYIAPEQALGRSDRIGPATDIYAIGATLFTMLAGEPPFSGKDAFTIMKRVVHQPPKAIRSLRADVPAKLEAIVERCLAKDPKRRFASAGELAKELNAFRTATYDSITATSGLPESSDSPSQVVSIQSERPQSFLAAKFRWLTGMLSR
jgi:serine/threonine protein kinase